MGVDDLLRLDAAFRTATTLPELEAIYLARDPAGVAQKFLLVSDAFTTKHLIRKFDGVPAAKSDTTPAQRKLNAARARGPLGRAPAPRE